MKALFGLYRDNDPLRQEQLLTVASRSTHCDREGDMVENTSLWHLQMTIWNRVEMRCGDAPKL